MVSKLKKELKDHSNEDNTRLLAISQTLMQQISKFILNCKILILLTEGSHIPHEQRPTSSNVALTVKTLPQKNSALACFTSQFLQTHQLCEIPTYLPLFQSSPLKRFALPFLPSSDLSLGQSPEGVHACRYTCYHLDSSRTNHIWSSQQLPKSVCRSEMSHLYKLTQYTGHSKT